MRTPDLIHTPNGIETTTMKTPDLIHTQNRKGTTNMKTLDLNHASNDPMDHPAETLKNCERHDQTASRNDIWHPFCTFFDLDYAESRSMMKTCAGLPGDMQVKAICRWLYPDGTPKQPTARGLVDNWPHTDPDGDLTAQGAARLLRWLVDSRSVYGIKEIDWTKVNLLEVIWGLELLLCFSYVDWLDPESPLDLNFPVALPFSEKGKVTTASVYNAILMAVQETGEGTEAFAEVFERSLNVANYRTMGDKSGSWLTLIEHLIRAALSEELQHPWICQLKKIDGLVKRMSVICDTGESNEGTGTPSVEASDETAWPKRLLVQLLDVKTEEDKSLWQTANRLRNQLIEVQRLRANLLGC